MWSTPSSTARRSTASAASRSRGGPKTPGPASCIAPNPMRPTGRPPNMEVLDVVMPPPCATVTRATRRASILGAAPPPSETRRSELAEFLKHRRARVSPETVGLEANGRRRTPGLRREEVAQLAGVGLSWYTWLEQGRDIRPSTQVLDALARTLRLDTGERAHLFHLARVELPLPAGDYPREAPPELRAVVDALVPNPAYLIGPRTDVLAWNSAAVRVIGEPHTAPDGRPTSCGGCSRPTGHVASNGETRRETRSPASARSTRAASATRTSPRSSRRSKRRARTSAPGGRATRSSRSSSARRRSTIRSSAPCAFTTCNPRPRATPTFA